MLISKFSKVFVVKVCSVLIESVQMCAIALFAHSDVVMKNILFFLFSFPPCNLTFSVPSSLQLLCNWPLANENTACNDYSKKNFADCNSLSMQTYANISKMSDLYKAG